MILHAELWTADGVPWKRMTIESETPEIEVPELEEVSLEIPSPTTTRGFRIRRFRRVGFLDSGTLIYREMTPKMIAQETELRRPWGQR